MGTYFVAMNEEHFKELLFSYNLPPPSSLMTETTLIKMGFPQKRIDDYLSLCICHKAPKYGGYYCPQCKSKFCELPVDCSICGLALVSSPQLARSYHHLFPVPIFEEIGSLSSVPSLSSSSVQDSTKTNSNSNGSDGVESSSTRCYGCQAKLSQSCEINSSSGVLSLPLSASVFRCPKCNTIFCNECDNYIHDYLHACPGKFVFHNI